MASDDYKRTCDRCGYNGPFKDLTPVGNGKFHCRDDRDGWTAEQTQRHRRPRRPILIKPRKHARITGEVPLYQQDEAELLGAILLQVTAATRMLTRGSVIGPSGAILAIAEAGSIAECGVYLRELLLEDKRPLTWMTVALDGLKRAGAALLTNQYGAPTGQFPQMATSDVLYGGVRSTNPAFPFVEGAAGLTFLALYELTGEQQWLDAADRCAWFLRQLQRADLLTLNPIVDSAGNRTFVGGWPANISQTKIPSPYFFTAHAWYLWFLARYRDVRGASYSLGTLTAAGDFTSAPAGTVQETIDAAVDFYVTGRFPYSTTTTPKIAPLSSTTPQYMCTPSAAARFSRATSGSYYGVNGCDMAFGLRGLYELEGYTDRVATIFEWLMGFESNAAFELTAGANFLTPLNVVRSGVKGTYDPETAMADFLALGTSQASAPTLQTNGTSLYSLPATAMLGPLYNASGRLLRDWKDALTVDRQLTSDLRDFRSARRYETVGLSFQLGVTSVEDLSMAVIARNALIYRAAPGAFNELRGLA